MTKPPPHILYIDDDEGIRRLVSRALQRRGFEVSLAASGPEGIAVARDRAFDLIAIDHYMPGQDGLATLDVLKNLPDCPPVVYVTGSEESRIAVAALKAGADDYVVKAVGDDFFDLLANTFEQVFERAELRGARARAEAELRATNARLEALLKEVNHRVANNLQMVMAFITMQAKTVTDEEARAALHKTQNRIATIAKISQRLYSKDDVEHVSLDEYLEGLLQDLASAWTTGAGQRDLQLRAAPVKMGTDRAVAIGMIANELVSNACKYAYGTQESGTVRVSLEEPEPGQIELVVEDDGMGLPADGSVKGTGLGTRLIGALVRSHQAQVRYDALYPEAVRKGTRATVTMPIGN